LIAGPSVAAKQPLENHTEAIIELSGHLPFFVQLACSAAFETLSEGSGGLDVDAIERRFMEEAESHFSYLWNNLDETERRLVTRIVRGIDLDPELAPQLSELEANGYVLTTGGRPRMFSRCLAPYLETMGLEEEPVAALSEGTASQSATVGIGAHVLGGGFETVVEPLPAGDHPFKGMIGESIAIRRALALIQKAATSDVTVLMLGDTGTGKERAAKLIHEHGERREGPFIVVNCGAIAESLQESELFGHRKGAFTGAVSDHTGLFEAADGGTILLDEIGETTPATQVKLLRVLQEGEIRRVGETAMRHVDVRVICATNRNLEAEVAQARFREDLYYRIFVLVVRMPALRERREDIPLLTQHFLQGHDVEIDPAAQHCLRQYDWPGNIRELENQLASARTVAGDACIETAHLWTRLQRQHTAPSPVGEGPPDPGSTLREARAAGGMMPTTDRR